MAKVKGTNSSGSVQKRRPAISPEAREKQMIALAVDLAEKQLMEGTASSQIITHYLKLATEKERLEREILSKQSELVSAKIDDIESRKSDKELYKKAIAAMKEYNGFGDSDDEYDY